MLAGRKHHRLAGEELHDAPGMHVEVRDGISRIVRGFVGGFDLPRVLGEDAEDHAGRPLLRAAFIKCGARFESLRSIGQIEGDDAVRVRADAILDGLARATQLMTFGVGVHTRLLPARFRGLPLDLRELLLAAVLQYETRFGPIRPVCREAIAAIGHDEEQLLRALQFHVDVHRMARRLRGKQFALEQWLRRGEGNRGKEGESEDGFHAGTLHTRRDHRC